MSVGFNNNIVFANTGKIIDYQKSFNDNYAKILNVFLPPSFNCKKQYKAILSIAINNTFPKEVENVLGVKSESDLNCYIFDVSDLYRKYQLLKKLGLSQFRLFAEDGRTKFKSESFRI